MTTRRTKIKEEWPEYHLISRKPLPGSLQYQGVPKLPALRFDGWKVERNLDFTYLQLSVTSQPKTLDKWVDVLSSVGQQYNVLVTTPRFKVLISRPVCTYDCSGCIFFHYMNRVPCLKNSP